MHRLVVVDSHWATRYLFVGELCLQRCVVAPRDEVFVCRRALSAAMRRRPARRGIRLSASFVCSDASSPRPTRYWFVGELCLQQCVVTRRRGICLSTSFVCSDASSPRATRYWFVGELCLQRCVVTRRRGIRLSTSFVCSDASSLSDEVFVCRRALSAAMHRHGEMS